MANSHLPRFQVTPSELENILVQHPLVHEAAVIGAWSADQATEIPCAFVVLKNAVRQTSVGVEGVSKDISDFVASRVSNYKRLRGGVIVIDSLPKNPTGKVLKKELKGRLEKESRQMGPRL